MSYYYPSAGMSPMDKTGMYPASLTGSAVPGYLGNPQQGGLPPGGPTRMQAYSNSTIPTAQAFQSMQPAGYAAGSGSPYATLSTSPYATPGALYQPAGLSYPTATLGSASLASQPSMYASPRIPATTAAPVYPGTSAYAAAQSMYGYSSMPVGASANPYGQSVAYQAAAMPSALSSYPTVPGGAVPPGTGAGYPGSSPYSRPI